MRIAANLGTSLLLAAITAAAPAMHAQISDTPPAGAPSAKCEVLPKSDPGSLRVFSKTTPLPYVFACGNNRPEGKCVVITLTPGSKQTPANTVIAFDHEQGDWSCIGFDGVSGWVPSNRLAPLPDQPTVDESFWLGWWRIGPNLPGIKNDRLLITKAPTPGTLHVSGRAYWYGLNDNVHFGAVNADVQPYGLYLHIVEGDDSYSCVVDLIADPAAHTFSATDNSNCGGMNVRFQGTWAKFTPTAKPRPH